MTDLAAANRAITDLYTTIGRNITAARRARGYTQLELARAVGLTRGSITNVEAGNQRSPLHIILMIAQTLDVELPELLADTPRLAGAPLPVVVGPLRTRLAAAQSSIAALLDALSELEAAE